MSSAAATQSRIDVRSAFPALNQEVNGKRLVYLDNAASSQVCAASIEAVDHFYRFDRANVHRGEHTLGQRATTAMERARVQMQAFLNAAYVDEVVFTSGTTEALNLLAGTFGVGLSAGDEVLITHMEHHSNIVPWQLLAQRSGIVLKVAPVTDSGELDMDAFVALLGPRTKLVSVVHVSNALGTINPVEEIVRAAHARGIPVMLDGAQAAPHLCVDVQALDADFYCLSGHKLFGPNGIGVLYGKRDRLRALPPWKGGGDMIESVSFEGTTFAEPPARFEAGTPNVAGIVGLGAAAHWLMTQDRKALFAMEHELTLAATEALSQISGLRLIGTASKKVGVCSFVMDGVPGSDVGFILDKFGVAVRTGHHCTEPLMRRFGVPGTIRASFAFYNTTEDVDTLAKGLHAVQRMVG
ncbi:MAG: aminotransferase class V-fold PLP-dependent enzyme [Myxococcota bacterium]